MDDWMNERVEEVICADCLEAMREMPDGSIDAIVTDPPYGLSFMGMEWDSFGNDVRQPGDEHYVTPDNPFGRGKVRYGYGSKFRDGEVAFQHAMTPIFAEALRVAKPGAHLLCFGGTRTFHRMACAIEDAGWEVRDCIMWVYGSGFPKSMDVGKAIDRALGAKREKVSGGRGPAYQRSIGNTRPWMLEDDHKIDGPNPVTDEAARWDGWGTCLKPAWEPIIVARRPLDGTVAHNVMEHGTGALNIDACRVPTRDGSRGRFPANLAHDGSEEVLACFPDAKGQQGDLRGGIPKRASVCYGDFPPTREYAKRDESDTSAARFFYCAKASRKERGEGNDHPTVKPLALMEWLVKLVTSEDAIVLDPFCGSGSTLVAAKRLGREFIGIDMEKRYCEIAGRRLEAIA